MNPTSTADTTRVAPTSLGSGPAIEVADLRLVYRTRTAFEGVSLSVPAGRILALVGPSGCGKTSFLCCLNRMTDLVPGAQMSGTVRVHGIDVRAPDIDVIQLRRRVGMIFQKPNPFPLSVWRNLELPLQEHGVRDRQSLAETIENALTAVGLWNEVKDRLKTPALALSGGQQQRLCIARALALKPNVLLLDEPCSALDPLSSSVVEDLIASLRPRYTVVIVTHNLSQARRLADNVAVFWLQDQAGRLIEVGPTEQVFQSPRSPIAAAYVRGQRG